MGIGYAYCAGVHVEAVGSVIPLHGNTTKHSYFVVSSFYFLRQMVFTWWQRIYRAQTGEYMRYLYGSPLNVLCLIHVRYTTHVRHISQTQSVVWPQSTCAHLEESVLPSLMRHQYDFSLPHSSWCFKDYFSVFDGKNLNSKPICSQIFSNRPSRMRAR